MALELTQADADAQSHWSETEAVRRMPRVSFGDVIASARRLVIVSPHPDDEVLGCGGLMADAAKAGLPIMIFSITDGENCYPDNPHWTPERLRQVRRQELAVALDTLGLVDPDVSYLGLVDGQVGHSAEIVADVLRESLRPSDLLLATWELDGHPDHESVGQAAREASLHAGCRLLRYPIWGRRWSLPGTDAFKDADTVRMELDPISQTLKTRALAAFQTQTGACEPPIEAPVLTSTILAHFSGPFEVFIR